MSLLDKFKIGEEVYIKSTNEISKIENVYCESGGICIILENGYRANSEDELEYPSDILYKNWSNNPKYLQHDQEYLCYINDDKCEFLTYYKEDSIYNDILFEKEGFYKFDKTVGEFGSYVYLIKYPYAWMKIEHPYDVL